MLPRRPNVRGRISESLAIHSNHVVVGTRLRPDVAATGLQPNNVVAATRRAGACVAATVAASLERRGVAGAAGVITTSSRLGMLAGSNVIVGTAPPGQTSFGGVFACTAICARTPIAASFSFAPAIPDRCIRLTVTVPSGLRVTANAWGLVDAPNSNAAAVATAARPTVVLASSRERVARLCLRTGRLAPGQLVPVVAHDLEPQVVFELTH